MHPAQTATQSSSPKLNGESLYNLTGHWRETSGEDFPLSRLRGRPVILTMAYTQCKVSCPAIIAKLKDIESALKSAKETNAAIVLASFDPKRDTPDHVATYFKEKKLDPKRWILLSPSGDRDVRELAAALGIVYSKDKNGEFSHSNVISLLNQEGVFQMQVNGLAASHEELVRWLVKASHEH